MLAPKQQPELQTSERHIRTISDKIDSVYYWLKAEQSSQLEPLVSDLEDARELIRGLQLVIDAERGEDHKRVFGVLKGGE